MNSLFILSFWQSIADLTDFYIWPILAGLLVGLLAPLIGAVIIIRRLSFIADTLSHFSLAGTCLGVLLGQILSSTIFTELSPVLMGVIFSVAGTFIIEKLRGFYKNYKELSMPIVMSLGAALTGIFIALSNGSSSNLTNTLLFGSIFTVAFNDFILILIIAFGIFIFAFFYYKKIISLCFDETFARVSGIKVKGLQLAITIILAIFISVSMQLVGVLLISALMIVPIASSILIGKSFKNTCIIAIVFSELSIIFGIYLSFILELPSGSLIVILNIIILLSIMCFNRIRPHQKKEKQEQNTEINYSLVKDTVIETDTSITVTPVETEINKKQEE